MNEDYSMMLSDTMEIVRKAVGNVVEHRNDETALYNETFESLTMIVNAFGTEEYKFNLSIEMFVEKSPIQIKGMLLRILENELPSSIDMFEINDDLKTVFATYYAVSLIFKKDNQIEELEKLLDSKYGEVFSAFPLLYEVHSRYYKRVGMYREALQKDRLAINLLASKSIQNYAVCTSYVSTICLMCSQNQDVESSEMSTAERYIDRAIEFNPVYPKYWYIKAQLKFYANRTQEISVFESACFEAIELIEEKALVFLINLYNGHGVHMSQELERYNGFAEFIRTELKGRKKQVSHVTFKELSSEEIQQMKHQIISSTKHSELFPPMPDLKNGDKYVFVCYSSLDYKSVYCDLVGLYANKVPFRYDERLTAGHGWTKQVENYIDDSSCVGVIFYISKNTLISPSFCEEIEMVCKTLKKDYFAVNLEGDALPSKILVQTILENCHPDVSESLITSKNVVTFLSSFEDVQVFTPKFREYGADGTRHLPNLKNQIKKRFNLNC